MSLEKMDEANSRVRSSVKPRVSYKNFQFLRVVPPTKSAASELAALEEEDGIEFWTQPVKNRTVDLLVPPEQASYVQKFLKEKKMEFKVLSQDLEVKLIF
jgi:hypothetical protein